MHKTHVMSEETPNNIGVVLILVTLSLQHLWALRLASRVRIMEALKQNWENLRKILGKRNCCGKQPNVSQFVGLQSCGC